MRQISLPTELDKRQLAFFRDWYNAAILEILRLDNSSDDADWIATNIQPKVPVDQISKSLDLLRELGYLRFDEKRKRLFPTDVTISTGNEVMGIALASYHGQWLKLAIDSIESIDGSERDISAITVSASAKLANQMKDEIIALRKRFLMLSAEDHCSDQVIQVNFQLFPLTNKKATK